MEYFGCLLFCICLLSTYISVHPPIETLWRVNFGSKYLVKKISFQILGKSAPMQAEMELVDPDFVEFRFPCVRARQPIGDLYIAVIPFKVLEKITYFDVRRVLQVERDVEKYLGIQRPLEERRVRDLENYVNYADATFPSAIIVAVEEEYANFDEVRKEMVLSNVMVGGDKPTIAISRIARVLDGQHRVAGLTAFKGDNFDLPVTVFIGADISDQAHVFTQ